MIALAGHELREGDIAAAGTYSKLLKVGPETRNAVIIKKGHHSIKEIVAVVHCDATDVEGAIFAVKLTGLKYGEYETLIGGHTDGTAVGNGADAKIMRPMVIKTNLAVDPGAQVWIHATAIGTKTAASCNVELVTDTSQGEKRYGMIRCVQIATPGTKTAMINDAVSATAYDIKIPVDATHISSVIPVMGGITLATASGGIGVVFLEGGLPDGDCSFTAGGHCGLATTAGLVAGYYEVDQIRTNIAVSPGSSMQPQGDLKGTDWGTVEIGVALEFACGGMKGPKMTYRERDLLVGGVDTWVLLTAECSFTTPGPLTVPTGFNRIRQILHAEGDSTPTAASRNHGTILKLTGVDDGEALLCLTGLTGTGVTGGDAGTQMGTQKRDVDIPVSAGKILSPYIDMSSGVDTSAPYASVTLGFATG